MTERPATYSGLQKLVHWITALMVFTLVPVGVYMVRRGAATDFDDLTGRLYTAHKTFGAVVLGLVVLRIVVRLTRGTPAPDPSLARIQVIAAEAVHGLIHLALLAVPILGWLGVSAYGAREILGGLSLPEILAKNEATAKVLLGLHGWAAFGLAALVTAHFGAALIHRFVFKDGVMKRMLS